MVVEADYDAAAKTLRDNGLDVDEHP